ncbi:MAG TPA: nicotinate (nicotinamide) nucleotide adenylyltransferase [Thermoanaerobaculia bacterium]|nr:nicotinate (nicotinamide) nucleotide adenylyltransferase [Thermoanaerobaculia bacterium]
MNGGGSDGESGAGGRGERVGLFGGSFDPIHRGHIEPVKEARRALRLDRVIYLPTAVPPHKPGGVVAPPLARYAMVELALLAEEGLYASPVELTLGRFAYTADTLDHFRRQLPQAELFLLIGSDSFADLPHWVRWRDITAAARLAVLPRPDWNVTALETSLAHSPELAALARGGRVHLLDQPVDEVSSTRLRELLGKGAPPPAGWLPELVLDFIHKYSLYR